jgi:hypothetical protein
VGSYIVIRPQDDAVAQQVSDWADMLMKHPGFVTHACVDDVDSARPANQVQILAALGRLAEVVLYFGHGDTDRWLTGNQVTLDVSNVSGAAGKAVVSIACKTGSLLAGNAITGGVTAWLGFTVRVPVLPAHKNVDPIGDAFVQALSDLGAGGTMQFARDQVAAAFDQLVVDFDTGRFSSRPDAVVGYYAAMAVRDHVVLHGSTSLAPLP